MPFSCLLMIVIRIIATSYAVVKWLKELSGSLGGK